MINNNDVKYFQVAQGVWGFRSGFTNIYLIANRKSISKGWILVDTGAKGNAPKIVALAEHLFGGMPPLAIVLTHGHPDHAGSVEELLGYWEVPVYAHALEIPYLTGLSEYAPLDGTVGNGLAGFLSVFFPRKPINLGKKVKPIDLAEGLAELPEWKVIPTPGHTPGHISLFFPLNTTLIAGDAFATTNSGSLIHMLANIKKLSGPPMYSTPDWIAAKESVRKLAALQPRIVAAGHGPVMRGMELQLAMQQLADDFDQVAVPSSGRYIGDNAAADETGTYYVPPFDTSVKFKAAVTLMSALAGFALVTALQKKGIDW